MDKLRMGVGILAVLLGIGIYAYPSLREWQFNRRTRSVIREFEERYQSAVEAENGGIGAKNSNIEADDGIGAEDNGAAAEDNEAENGVIKDETAALYEAMLEYNEKLLRDGQKLTDAWSYQQEPINLNLYHLENNVVGYIEIPDMDVLLPLYLGASAENLSCGAAVLSQTSLPVGGVSSNCVIAGHRGYGGMAFFREIENLVQGSCVYIVNPWETLVYQAVEARVIESTDIASILIQEGKDLVTLITCHPYLSGGSYRYVVYCERVEGKTEESGWVHITGGEGNKEEAVNAGVFESGEEDMFQIIPEASGDARETVVASSVTLIRSEKVLRMAVPAIMTICIGILFLRGKFHQK